MNTKRLAEINAGSCPSIDEWKELVNDRAALIEALRELLACSTMSGCERKDTARRNARAILAKIEGKE